MAKARGGTTGLVVALVALSIIWVVTLVVAIMLNQQREGHIKAKATAEDALKEYIKPTEAKQPWVLAYLERATKQKESVVALQQKEIQSLRSTINGDSSANPEASEGKLRDDLAAIGIKIEGKEPLISMIDVLRKNLASEQGKIKDMRESLEKLEQELVKTKADAGTASREFAKAKGELDARLASVQQASDKFKGSVNGEYKKLQDRLAALQQEKQTATNDRDTKIEQLNAELESLRNKLKERAPKKPSDKIGAPDPTRQPDGTIVSIQSDDKNVYIDRGSKDRLVLGMTFEVYDRKAGVVPDEFGELRGKGSIEVVSMSETSAVARIVRTTRGKAIVAGDVIANAVYSPDKLFKFHVFGNFDIDGIGKASEDDRKRLEAMIRNWGGTIAASASVQAEGAQQQAERRAVMNLLSAAVGTLQDGKTAAEAREMVEQGFARFSRTNYDQQPTRLSPDVDFLVLGSEPKAPERPAANAEEIEHVRYKQQVQIYENYKALEQEARDLGIPILNQNRLLQMVGFFDR